MAPKTIFAREFNDTGVGNYTYYTISEHNLKIHVHAVGYYLNNRMFQCTFLHSHLHATLGAT